VKAPFTAFSEAAVLASAAGWRGRVIFRLDIVVVIGCRVLNNPHKAQRGEPGVRSGLRYDNGNNAAQAA
jgi:hypothetical protein